jgi:mannose-6-phosphate isomerase-like protein (cupin superfamily)
MDRRRVIPAFKTAAEIGNYEDVALIPEDVDPQVELSRNSVTQPFYVVIAEDTVLAQMSGRSTVRMKYSSANRFTTRTGDHVYVPAGTPHRIEPLETGVLVRYTSNEPVRRGAAFFCEHCDEEIYRLEWEHDGSVTPVTVYTEVLKRFNGDESGRVCSNCSEIAETISLDELGWDD